MRQGPKEDKQNRTHRGPADRKTGDVDGLPRVPHTSERGEAAGKMAQEAACHARVQSRSTSVIAAGLGTVP